MVTEYRTSNISCTATCGICERLQGDRIWHYGSLEFIKIILTQRSRRILNPPSHLAGDLQQWQSVYTTAESSCKPADLLSAVRLTCRALRHSVLVLLLLIFQPLSCDILQWSVAKRVPAAETSKPNKTQSVDERNLNFTLSHTELLILYFPSHKHLHSAGLSTSSVFYSVFNLLTFINIIV